MGPAGGVIADLVLTHLHGDRGLEHAEAATEAATFVWSGLLDEFQTLYHLRRASGFEKGNSRRSDILA